MINFIDNFLSEEDNLLVHNEIVKIPCLWAAADESLRKELPRSNFFRFWTGKIYTKEKDIYPNIFKLREKIVDKIFVGKKYKFDAMYINIHNIGDESLIHRDNGDITFIYYSNPNWKLHWDGGTAFYNQEISDTIGTVSYKPARLVMFDSKTPHKPLSISKYAVDIRTVLVFKCTEVK